MAGACWREEYLAIPQRVKHQWEAWEFVEYVCLNKQSQMLIYKSEGTQGLPAYMPCWNSPVFGEKDPLFGGQRIVKLWLDTAKSIPAFKESYDSYLALYTVLHYEKQVTCDGMSIDEVINVVRQKLNEDKENR